jgi:FHA domain
MVLPEGILEVGRSSDCWLTLEDEISSRVHARFHVDAEGCEIEDLGSRNGTFVNGDRIVGRRRVFDGDRIRIGRELMTMLESDTADVSDTAARLRQTLAPGEQAGMPELMGQLIDKALKVGKPRDAERYASALVAQLGPIKLPVDHPSARTAVDCLVRVAEQTGNGAWLDKLFHLHAEKRWVLEVETLDKVRGALDRIPRIPGHGLPTYEARLRELGREGVELPPRLVEGIGELVDAYGDR